MENINDDSKIYDKTCAHIACQCPPDIGSDYCSPTCEKASGSTDCSCGHAECRAEA